MEDFHVDFAVLLTLATLVTGIGWALNKWVLAPRRREGVPPNAIVDFCQSFFPVIAAVLLLRSFVAEPFRIPSGSMIPTLLVGDFILVNKFAYGLRDPAFHYKFLQNGEPQRGDIVVFRYPQDVRQDYIKRIIGLPGDHLSYRDKRLSINGQEINLQADGAFQVSGGGHSGVIYRMLEDLDGVEHHVLVDPDMPSGDFEFTVPPGQYYAMGDNRDGSSDSRVWGTVPEKNLVGKAFFIWMSWDGADKRVNFSRIGTVLK